MYLYIFLNIIVAVAGFIAMVYLAWRLYAYKQGDAKMVPDIRHRTPFVVETISFDRVVFSCEIPIKNRGKQLGTIIDCFPRVQLPQEQYKASRVNAWLMLTSRERDDGYWEAFILESNVSETIRLRVAMNSTSGNIREDLKNFPDMSIDIYFQIVARSDWYLFKERIVMSAEEVQNALGAAGGASWEN